MVPVVIALAILIVYFEFRYVGDLMSQTIENEQISNFTMPVNQSLNILQAVHFDERPLVQKFRSTAAGSGSPQAYEDFSDEQK